MNKDDAIDLCKSYNLSAADLQVSAAVELSMMGVSDKKKKTLDNVVEQIRGIFTHDQLMSVVKWATWRKHAKKTGQEGTDYPSLLDVRKGSVT